MKAPDKIYVAISKFMCPGLASRSKLKDDMTEYIRKDALLEWVREELDNTSILRSERIETLQKVIDKLNSM